MTPTQPRPSQPIADNDPLFTVGTQESLLTIKNEEQSDSFLRHNATASLAQVSRERLRPSTVPTVDPATGRVPSMFTASTHAKWYASVGLPEGVTHNSTESVMLSVARQRESTRRVVERLKPLVARAYAGGGVDPADTGLGDKLLAADVDIWVDMFGQQLNPKEKEDFRRYIGSVDAQMGISPFNELRNFVVGLSPVHKEGRLIYEKMSARDGFRIPTTDEGLRQLESLSSYRRYLSESGQDSMDFASIPEMFANAITNVARGIGNIAVPDDDISDEWRSDPNKYARVRAALDSFAKIGKLYGENPLLDSGTEKEITYSKRVAASRGMLDTLNTKDVIVSNPAQVGRMFVDEHIGSAKELVQLYNEGAFKPNSRLAPLASSLDGLVVSTAGLAALFYHSEDPNSLVNVVRQIDDNITLSDESIRSYANSKGITVQKAKEQMRKLALIETINSALEFREAEANWQRYGWAFRTNGGATGKTYIGDLVGLGGDNDMLQGAQILADPFVAAGLGFKAVKAASAARTATQLTGRLASATRALEKLQSIGITTGALPDTLKPMVENIRVSMASKRGVVADTISEMDVLSHIERGEARIGELVTDKSGATRWVERKLTKSELAMFSDEVVKSAARVEAYHAKRIAAARKLMERNQGKPLSTWGKWVGENFLTELSAGFDNPIVKKLIDSLTKVGITGQVGQSAAADVSRGALNRSAIFGGAKAVDIWRRISGAGAAGVAAVPGNPFSLAAGAVGVALFLPDLLSAVGWSGNTGKYFANYMRYYGANRQLGGSIAAARLRDISSEIERLNAFKSGGASLTEEEIKKWRLGEISAGRLSSEQIRTIEAQIELLTGEAAWVQNLHSIGFESIMVGAMKNSGALISSTLVLDAMLKANDSNSRIGTAAMFAMSGNVLNSAAGVFYRNTNNVRRRVDINRIEFHNLIHKSKPHDAQRLIQAYIAHRSAGTADNFVQAIVHLNRIVNPNTGILYVDRAGMAANSQLIQAANLVDSTSQEASRLRLEAEGKAKGLSGRELGKYIRNGLKNETQAATGYDLRRTLIEEANARGLKGDEVNAFVQTELEKRLAARASVEQKQKLESEYSMLAAESRLIADKVEKAHVEEASALDVLEQSYSELGIPLRKKDGSPVAFAPADFSSAEAFVDAVRREAGQDVIGGVVDGKATGLMALPPDQFKEMFERFKIAQVGHLNAQKGKMTLIADFNSVMNRFEAVSKERMANIDMDASLDTRNWRRGSTFVYTDYGMGSGPGLGYVVADGVFVVDRPMPDGTVKSDIVLNLEDLKIGPIYEELAHAIFVSTSFRGFRNLIEKNLYGDWVFNPESGTWISKNPPEGEASTHPLAGLWASKNSSVEGVLVSFDDKGKPSMPALRLFAEAYSDNLTPEGKRQFMSKFDRAEELFSQNPELGIRLMQDVTNELFAFAYRQRLMNASPGSFKNSYDPAMTATSPIEIEGSPLTPNAGDAGPASNSRASASLKTMFYKMLVGELTANEGAQMLLKIQKGDFGPMSPSEMQLMGTESIAKLLAVFGRNGIYDRLTAKTLSKHLLESGLSPEIFGAGNWSSAKLFHEVTGEALDLPPGLREIVDTVHYFARDRIGETDPYMFEDYSVWDSKTGVPIDVWPPNHPLAGQPVNHVLYAATRNNMNLIDGRTGKLRNLHEIISEERRSMDQFTRLLLHGNQKGEITSFQVTDGAVYLNGAGKMTKQESERIIKAAKDSKMNPNQLTALIKIVSDLADSNPDNPIIPERAGRLPIYQIIYRGVEQQDKMGRHRRVGGILSDRHGVIYNVFTDWTGFDSNGRPIIDERGNQQYIRAAYANMFDLDALGRRFELFWNGQLRDENGAIPTLMKYNSVRARFKNKSEIQEVVDQYLVHLAEGGRIARDLKDTKAPSKTAVETFRDFLISQGRYPDQAEAEYLARVAHFVVGSRASEYILTGKMPGEGVPDMDIGSRKLRQRGSIPDPVQAANDMNFPITTIRLDRVVSLADLKGYGSMGGQYTFPWTQFSSGWLNVAYSASNGWNTLVPPKGSSYGMFLTKEIAANTALEKQVAEGVKALYSHPLGYKIISLSNGKYQIYDADAKFVRDVTSYGDAVAVATSHARMRPLRSNSQFDALMTNLGFSPVGLETVNLRGQRRANFLTPDKQFTIRFNQRGIATIVDNNTNSTVAKNIAVDLQPDGNFDFSELQAALQLSYDNVTLGASKLDLSVVPEETTPMQSFLFGGAGLEHRGLTRQRKAKSERAKQLEAKYGPDFIEFVPVVVGRNVQGKKMYSRTNQAYYTIKARLIDAYGPKGALVVISEMKKQLGDDVVSTSEKAVVEWFDAHLRTKESERIAAERQAEIDRKAKEWTQATSEVDKRKRVMRAAFTDPVNRAILGINQSRQTSALPPISSISPAESRANLVAELDAIKRRLASQPESDAANLADFRAAMERLGGSTENLSRNMAENTAVMWKNNAGYIIMLDMLDQPTPIHGLDVSVNMSWLSQRLGQGNAKLRFRVYNPNGALMGYYSNRQVLAEDFLERVEATANQNLSEYGKNQSFKRDINPAKTR
jgi:hypothetical protein